MIPLKWVEPLPPWLTWAVMELFAGVKEVRGGENPRILFYHDHTKYKATEDEVAWCSAFANAALYNAGMEGTFAAAARSWIGWGDQIKEWRLGCVAVLWRGSPDSWQGHVGFVVNMDKTHVHILGGNQSDSVSIAKFPVGQILSLRWPKNFEIDEYYPIGDDREIHA